MYVSVGHFTQVVWKSTREMGFGFAKSRNGSWYYCCNYYPAGNFAGERTDNVEPLEGSETGWKI